jgi:acyl-coenzyme A thioesterase PaaI-like protein
VVTRRTLHAASSAGELRPAAPHAHFGARVTHVGAGTVHIRLDAREERRTLVAAGQQTLIRIDPR